jgi:RHS repeat-associated protein
MIFFKNESLLHYNYYRTYNPDTGRYMQSDPIGLAAGANTYNYVGGNPLSGVDPLGLQSVGLSIEVPVAEAITSKGLNVMRDTGHTFIWTKDLNGNITSLYSFGPKEHIGIFNSLKFFNGNMSGNSKYEIDSGNVNTWAWKLTESQYSQCIQNIEKAKNISKNYTVDNQCTSTSIALATSCGIMNMPSGVSAVTINTKSGYSLYNKNLPNPYGLYTQLSKFIKPVEESSSVYMKYNQ